MKQAQGSQQEPQRSFTHHGDHGWSTDRALRLVDGVLMGDEWMESVNDQTWIIASFVSWSREFDPRHRHQSATTVNTTRTTANTISEPAVVERKEAI
jgi:hypothetical protein